MPIKAGTVADFSGSMAEAMENALKAEYLALKGEPLPDMAQDDRRMMLAAIAQGVVRHLKDHLDAMQISVETTQVVGVPGAPLIRSENPAAIVAGVGNIPAGSADVTQIAAADNRVVSRGTATLDDLLVTGVLHP
jgi:hypothetical protein